MEIVRSLARRIAEMEAVARKNASQAEELAAKAEEALQDGFVWRANTHPVGEQFSKLGSECPERKQLACHSKYGTISERSLKLWKL